MNKKIVLLFSLILAVAIGAFQVDRINSKYFSTQEPKNGKGLGDPIFYVDARLDMQGIRKIENYVERISGNAMGSWEDD